jgi:hypothetical protein
MNKRIYTKKQIGIRDRTSTEGDALVELVETLLKIDDNAPLAKLNKTSISDINGGRIAL